MRRGVLALAMGLLAVTAFSATETLSLDGDWELAYSPHFLETDDYPAFAGKLVKGAVPGYWEDLVPALRAAGIRDEFRINPEWRECRLPLQGWAPDTQLPQPYGLFYYRRTFAVASPRNARLRFGGVRNDIRVWLNGKFLEKREGYSTPFAMEVPAEFLRAGENEIVLAVQNKLNVGYNGAEVRGLTSRALFRATGGVNGSVALEFPGDDLRELYVTTAADCRSFTVHVDGQSEYRYEIFRDADGQPLVSGRGRGDTVLAADGFELWSPERPTLYRLRLTTAGAEHELRFGLRRLVAVDPKLFLNGEPVILRGITEHCYFPLTVHLPHDLEYFRELTAKRKELGFNFVRFHTYVPTEEYLTAMDELGMLVQIESPNFVPEWEYAAIIAFARRHPCVVIYCTGNETRIDRLAEAYLERIAELVHTRTDALFSPMSALRGVTYFLSHETDPLVAQPFLHNRERAERLAKYSDLFNSVSLETTSYNYVDGRSDEFLESVASVWCGKPRLLHELCIDGTYADLLLEARYPEDNPIRRTGLFSEVRRVLTEKGLVGNWGVYFTNSCHWVALTRKFCFEKARSCETVAGFDFLGDINSHWHTFGYSVGMMDEFCRLKPGESVARVRRYNSPAVLLADFATEFVFEAGTVRKTKLRLSNYAGAIAEAELTVRLVEDQSGRELWRATRQFPTIANGCIAELGEFAVELPQWERPGKCRLEATLTSAAVTLDNCWDLYVFPQVGEPEGAGVRVVTDIARDELLAAMRRGERVALLGAGPFKTSPMSANTGRAGRCSGNFATVIRHHPALGDFPHEGFCGWQFRQLMNKAKAVQLEAAVPFAPIVDVASAVKCPIRQAALFEYQVGEGRLLVCSFNFRATDPAARYLKSQLVRYLASAALAPAPAISVAELQALIDHPAVKTTANPNRAANPGDPSGWVRVRDHIQP